MGKRGELVELSCRSCDKPFRVWPSYAKRGAAFCSRACSHTAQSTNPTIECQWCGAAFVGVRSLVERGSKTACSTKCGARLRAVAAIERRRDDFLNVFWSHVTEASGDSCWLWRGQHREGGYGRVRDIDGHIVYAHRLMFAFFNGYAPPCVRHSCDNPPCVNPSHLLGGTQIDNIADRVVRGRSAHGDSWKGGLPKGYKFAKPRRRAV